MDVENIDALTPAELEAVLERALDPRVPVELLYAVLERLGRLDREAAAARPPAEAPAAAAEAVTAWLPAVPAQAAAPAAPAPEAAGESEN